MKNRLKCIVVMSYVCITLIACGFKNSNESENKGDTLKNVELGSRDSISFDSLIKPPFEIRQVSKKQLLPLIGSIKYVPVSKTYEEWFQARGFAQNKDSLLKILKYYNIKLGNIGKYETYYLRLNCGVDSDFTPSQICQPGIDSFGFLILFDPYLNKAIVIMVEYSFSIDTVSRQMAFTLPRKNEIEIVEGIYSETADEADDPYLAYFIRETHLIEVLSSGELKISSKVNHDLKPF